MDMLKAFRGLSLATTCCLFSSWTGSGLRRARTFHRRRARRTHSLGARTHNDVDGEDIEAVVVEAVVVEAVVVEAVVVGAREWVRGSRSCWQVQEGMARWLEPGDRGDWKLGRN